MVGYIADSNSSETPTITPPEVPPDVTFTTAVILRFSLSFNPMYLIAPL